MPGLEILPLRVTLIPCPHCPHRLGAAVPPAPAVPRPLDLPFPALVEQDGLPELHLLGTLGLEESQRAFFLNFLGLFEGFF